eukprot:COSAG02_NODE_13223_length_1423_cov_11.557162_1_plen_64_part_10
MQLQVRTIRGRRFAVAYAHGLNLLALSVDDLRKALGEKLQTDENWEWADEDWADVDDFVQVRRI